MYDLCVGETLNQSLKAIGGPSAETIQVMKHVNDQGTIFYSRYCVLFAGTQIHPIRDNPVHSKTISDKLHGPKM